MILVILAPQHSPEQRSTERHLTANVFNIKALSSLTHRTTVCIIAFSAKTFNRTTFSIITFGKNHSAEKALSGITYSRKNFIINITIKHR